DTDLWCRPDAWSLCHTALRRAATGLVAVPLLRLRQAQLAREVGNGHGPHACRLRVVRASGMPTLDVLEIQHVVPLLEQPGSELARMTRMYPVVARRRCEKQRRVLHARL